MEKKIRYATFVKRFKPIMNPNEGSYQFETYGDDYDKVVAATKENRVWTVMDNDYGKLCLVSGWHFVNRLCYYICEVPTEPDVDYYVLGF